MGPHWWFLLLWDRGLQLSPEEQHGAMQVLPIPREHCESSACLPARTPSHLQNAISWLVSGRNSLAS